jgi:hypothetical protein
MKRDDALKVLKISKDYYKVCALKSMTLFKWALTLKVDELPLYINHKDNLVREMILARLRGEDILDNPKFVLSSIDASGEDLNESVITDMDLAEIYKDFIEVNDNEHAKEAISWIYREDNIPEEEEVNA